MKMKKLLAMVLCVAMVLSMMAFTVSAETDYVAKIDGVEFTDFNTALTTAASKTGNVEVEIYEKVTLNSNLSGNYDSIKFVGKNESAEIFLDIQGCIYASGKNVTFKDLKLSKVAGGYVADAGFRNLAFGVYDASSVLYDSCIFLNGAYASKGIVTFTGCTFYRSHDRYGLWAYGEVDCIVDGCTFADIRGIKMYDEGKFKVTNLTVKNTDFSAVDNKPAIVLTHGKSVTLEGNTYSEKGVFELDLDGIPNGTKVVSDVPPTCVNDNGECGVIVDDKIYTTVTEAATVATSGSEVTLLYDTTENVTFDKGVILNVNGCTAPNVKVTTPVAEINGVEYYSLNTAFAAVADGDVINLLGNVVIDESTHAHNSGSWYDGVYYIGDKSFTVNLNGYTITHDGSVNDYLLNFKNDGAKANTLTIKNGTLDAGTTAFCAICTSTGSTQQITIDLEDVNLINNNANGATAKIRGGAVLNVKEGTVITGKDSYIGIEVYGSTSVANIYDGAELYQNGISSYVGSLAGVSGGGTLNVYGGYGKSVQGGFIAMTSGGTINVYGGEWIANTDGTYANSNSSVLISQNNQYESGYAGPSIINVYGGTFLGGMNVYIQNPTNPSFNEVSELNISGGVFNADPSAYLADGYVVTSNPVSGKYEVSGENLVANEISVVFEEVASGSEDEKLFNINLVATSDINEFASAEFTFVNTSKLNNGLVMPYVITAAENMTLTNPKEGYYGFAMDGVNKFEISGNKITIGQVRFTGYGDIDFNVASGIVNATTVLNNLVKTYTTNGAVSGDITKGDLIITTGVIDETIAVPVRTLTVNVTFPNAVIDNKADYQNMKVEITGNIDGKTQTVTYDLGKGTGNNASYEVKENRLVLHEAYTVTVSGDGYRTARYTVTMTGDKKLNFWNNVMDNKMEVEENKASSAVFKNFLAGDIVADNNINIYDLSAVVSYFTQDAKEDTKYIKYDLNRDGIIDSKDVAYVLVSWGE